MPHGLFLIVGLLIFSGSVSSTEAAGIVKGKIVDARNNRSLSYANVVILGTQFGAIAQQNGGYTIHSVPPGTYTLQASYVGYVRASKAQVTVTEGGIAEVDFALLKASVDDVQGSASLGDLASAIARADSVTILQGLPRTWTLSTPECDSTVITTIAGYWFFRDPATIRGVERKEIEEIMTAKNSFEPWAGEKLCGGFHPDFCLQWHCAEAVHRALVCFGCHEVIYAGPQGSVRCDLGDKAYREFQGLLAGHKKHPPCNRRTRG
jgi:hypothetical protein